MTPKTALSIIAQASALSFAVSCSSPQRTSSASSVAIAKPGPAHGWFAGAVTALADKLEASYVIRDVGARYAARLRTNLAQGAYDGIVDHEEIARQLAHDLQAVAPDGHLRVVPDTSLTPDGHLRAPGGPGAVRGPGGLGGPARPPAIGDMAWLADGVAYIQFNEFPGDPETVAAVDRFMMDHASAKAIIIDARSHHGGGTAEMNVMLPYLYAKETTLVDMDAAEQVGGNHDGPTNGGPGPGVVLGSPGQLRGHGISTQDGRSLRVIPGPPGLLRLEHVAIPHPTEHRLFAAKVF